MRFKRAHWGSLGLTLGLPKNKLGLTKRLIKRAHLAQTFLAKIYAVTFLGLTLAQNGPTVSQKDSLGLIKNCRG